MSLFEFSGQAPFLKATEQQLNGDKSKCTNRLGLWCVDLFCIVILN